MTEIKFSLQDIRLLDLSKTRLNCHRPRPSPFHCITGTTLYSGGWDHSVRRWDVQTGINTETYNGSKAVASVAAPAAAPAIVAFGGSDKALRLWDSRCVIHRALM